MATRLKLTQARSQERRRKIVAAATRLFGRRGIAQTSLTDIARLAGVPLSSLYDYFKDKRSLVAAVPEENYLALYRQLEDARSADPRRQLREIYTRNLEYIQANPDWGRVFFLEIWPSAAIGEARIRRAVDRYGLRYVELIRAAVPTTWSRAARNCSIVWSWRSGRRRNRRREARGEFFRWGRAAPVARHVFW